MANFSVPDISIISSRLESAESGHFDLLTALGEWRERGDWKYIWFNSSPSLIGRHSCYLLVSEIVENMVYCRTWSLLEQKRQDWLGWNAESGAEMSSPSLWLMLGGPGEILDNKIVKGEENLKVGHHEQQVTSKRTSSKLDRKTEYAQSIDTICGS